MIANASNFSTLEWLQGYLWTWLLCQDITKDKTAMFLAI